MNSPVFSQQSHFIYIQSEAKQPFSIKINSKQYGSSGSGYVIIPQLPTGEYFMELSFPQISKPYGWYRIVVNLNDIGLSLKQENGNWVFENMQSTTIISATGLPELTTKTVSQTAGNKFGEMLSQVVNDPELLKKQKPGIKNETPVTKPDTTAVTTVTETDDADSIDINTSGVIKAAEDETAKGTNLVFVDFNQRSSDTIRIFIPNGNDVIDNIEKPVADSVKSITLKSTDSVNMQSKVPAFVTTYDSSILIKDTLVEKTKTETPIIEKTNPVDSIPATIFTATETTAVADSVNNPFHNVDSGRINTDSVNIKLTSFINTNCKGLANNDDFLKLRKKMAAQSSAEAMTQTAKKAFKLKCYTVEQVKNLGNLFLNDQNRYAFFEAIYTSTFDQGNFGVLQSQLLDNYYKQRLSALIQ
jgi:hypothetical protein